LSGEYVNLVDASSRQDQQQNAEASGMVHAGKISKNQIMLRAFGDWITV
jgi:hypothetical protein